MRCAIYACDEFWLATLLAAIAFVNDIRSRPWAYELVPSGIDPAIIVALAFSGWCLWRLRIAYRKYLQFPHAFATVLASQIIVLLIVAELTIVI